MRQTILAAICGIAMGSAATLAISVMAQQRASATQDQRFAIASPKENYVWRLDVVTGDLIHCYNGPGNQALIVNEPYYRLDNHSLGPRCSVRVARERQLVNPRVQLLTPCTPCRCAAKRVRTKVATAGGESGGMRQDACQRDSASARMANACPVPHLPLVRVATGADCRHARRSPSLHPRRSRRTVAPGLWRVHAGDGRG